MKAAKFVCIFPTKSMEEPVNKSPSTTPGSCRYITHKTLEFNEGGGSGSGRRVMGKHPK